ncbi:hypothetical protein [Paraburkholderia sp. GAS334]|uniref:hypothetical protein n=1 Tax=Paraburkholderia sp. GAS334 TaxID=3035131 RepID=UPI003D24E77B
MSNFLMLLIAAAGTSSLCACSTQTQVAEPPHRATIVVHEPKREEGDFVLCDDGRVIVFPASHPKTCT